MESLTFATALLASISWESLERKGRKAFPIVSKKVQFSALQVKPAITNSHPAYLDVFDSDSLQKTENH